MIEVLKKSILDIGIVTVLMEHRIHFLKVESYGHLISSSTIENFVEFSFLHAVLIVKHLPMMMMITMNH
jgi:hypothetical protein